MSFHKWRDGAVAYGVTPRYFPSYIEAEYPWLTRTFTEKNQFFRYISLIPFEGKLKM